LEEGRPTVDAAVRRLTFEIHTARKLGYAVLKLIHGYGSSGPGGRIRLEARRYLARLQQKGEIRSFLTGEQFSIFDEATRAAFAFCDSLRRDSDLDRHNNGVTFVLL
jgi:hypothetical protein